MVQEGWNSGEATSAQGLTANEGTSYQQAERRFLLPQELMDMPVGTGRIWTPGSGTTSIPFFAPNFWKRRTWSNTPGNSRSRVKSTKRSCVLGSLLPCDRRAARRRQVRLQMICEKRRSVIFLVFSFPSSAWGRRRSKLCFEQPWPVLECQTNQ